MSSSAVELASSATTEEAILVAVRVRKLLKREAGNVWKWTKEGNQVKVPQLVLKVLISLTVSCC